jgi:hypothetical protein
LFEHQLMATQPTAPLRYAYNVDFSWCAESGCHSRLPELWLSFISLNPFNARGMAVQ